MGEDQREPGFEHSFYDEPAYSFEKQETSVLALSWLENQETK